MDSNPIDDAVKSGRIEAAEDVEGHVSSNRIDGQDTDDVEGHRRAPGLVEDDDTEGHGYSSGR